MTLEEGRGIYKLRIVDEVRLAKCLAPPFASLASWGEGKQNGANGFPLAPAG
jgi:hypothetical protein